MADYFAKFTERARRVLTRAQEEAQRFNHSYIGTEHLLLGLVREGDGVAARVLNNLGVELPKVRSGVEAIIGRGETMIRGEIGLTPRAKKVIELAVDEARRLNHHYIGTEHLLLGLVREGEGIAAGVLASLGVSLERTRTQVMQAVTTRASDVAYGEPPPPVPLFAPIGELLRVLPVAQTVARPPRTLSLLALELYDNGIVVTVRLTTTDDPAAAAPLFDLIAEDDRGGRYSTRTFNVTGGGPERAEWRFALRLNPAFDPEACALTLTLRAKSLPGRTQSDESSAPWTFTIAFPATDAPADDAPIDPSS